MCALMLAAVGYVWAQHVSGTDTAFPVGVLRDVAAEDATGEAAQVIALDKHIGEAMIAGDVAAWGESIAPDFQMTHGAAWTSGGKPTQQDTKEAFAAKVKVRQYRAYELSHVKIEMHATTAIVYGKYVANIPASATRPANMAWLSCWFEHLYEKQNGRWMYVSHRTISGPVYGATRAEVIDK